MFACLNLTLTLYSKTSVGAHGHTTGRILRRLENEQNMVRTHPASLNPNPKGFPRPPAMPEGSVSGSRLPGTPASLELIPGVNSRSVVWRGGRGQNNIRQPKERVDKRQVGLGQRGCKSKSSNKSESNSLSNADVNLRLQKCRLQKANTTPYSERRKQT